MAEINFSENQKGEGFQEAIAAAQDELAWLQKALAKAKNYLSHLETSYSTKEV